MKQIIEDFQLLNSTTKRNEKDFILESFHQDNHTDTIELLKFLYNPRIVTGISNKKMNKSVQGTPNTKVSELSELLDYLSKNNTGRDEDILVAKDFIENNKEYSDFITQIITKTYKTGVTAKTLNKVYGKNFVPLMELQLAESYEKHVKKLKDNEKFFLTIKYDGHRALTEINTKKSFTRSGLLVEGLKEIQEELEILKPHFNSVGIHILDGEFLIYNSDKPKEEWFNETTKILRSDSENKTNIQYIVFDGVSEKEFYIDKVSTQNYNKRRVILEKTFKLLEDKLKYIKLAPLLYQGTEKDKIIEFYETAVDNGEEGIMLNLDTPYYCKRTKTLLKVKPTKSADLEIVGFEKGGVGTKYENTLGALIVDYKGVKVGVGSGLTDDIRNEIWNNQNDYLGKIAEINYTSESKNQNNNEVNLRFPRFKTIRYDKTLDDINIE